MNTMLIKTFAGALVLASTVFAGAAFAESGTQASSHQIQQIRNATIKVTYGETTFLIDPMLAEQGAYPGFPNTYRSELRNPLVGLPMAAEDVIEGADAVIVTHTHLDHWDDAAQKLLPKELPLFVQNVADAEMIRSQGFQDVRILDGQAEFGGVTLHKTGGQHGSDTLYAIPELAKALGEVMGVVFEAEGREITYVVGDTVWRDEVVQSLERFQPDVVVLNAGAAEFTGFEGDPIIMGKEDTLRVHRVLPDADIVAVHMDAVNHMTLSREELAEFVENEGIAHQVLIPADGESLSF
jgi:L-ascorbate metabolism protein UlaG (beta-lactamase superfamily)|tara:strand:- start:2672 stop:3559 length:888 start_codon:yes stop_codon:yes gene_type:complete